jgi:hypothetical protein
LKKLKPCNTYQKKYNSSLKGVNLVQALREKDENENFLESEDNGVEVLFELSDHAINKDLPNHIG